MRMGRLVRSAEAEQGVEQTGLNEGQNAEPDRGRDGCAKQEIFRPLAHAPSPYARASTSRAALSRAKSSSA